MSSDKQIIGDTITIEFEAKLDDGTVLDLTSATLAASMRRVGTATAIPCSSAAAVAPAATSGRWRATWLPAVTGAFSADWYEYDGKVGIASDVYHVGEGTLSFKAGIS
jgi:hypothetical protein